MNTLHWVLFSVVLGFFVLRIVVPRHNPLPWHFLRYATLTLCGLLFLAPFFLLLCAAFKDPSVLMEYSFLPPLSAWSSETLNLSNLRRLFEARYTQQGVMYFWRHILNSLFFASTTTVVQLFFCSLGGFALAKYYIQGRQLLLVF